MKTEQAMRGQLKQVVQKRGLEEQNAILRGNMSYLKTLCKRMIEQVEQYEARKYTGWWALLAQDGDGKWSCVDIVDPDDEKWCDEDFPAFTLIMPIPEPDTMPEWDGF